MAHDDVNDLKQRVSNQSVQIMRLEERVRSLTKERDHWIAEAGKARDEARKAEDSLRAERVPPFIANLRAQLDAVERLREPAVFEPYTYPQSWWQRIVGRLFA